MSHLTIGRVLASVALLTGVALPRAGRADETVKLGLSVPLSGAAAVWGKGCEWLCKRAAAEIKEAGGVKVQGKVYEFECVAYDNKYNAGEGTKVAQTLLNRERVKFVASSIGTAPIQALQSLSERQGVVLFSAAWGKSIKGPKFPLTFTASNTHLEILPPLIAYVTHQYPKAKRMVVLNPNDATGRDVEAASRKLWEKAGVTVLSSDFYERGTTEFQPVAARLAAAKPDVINLGTTPPADAGVILKELDVLGWKGVKVAEVGTGADALRATGGPAANGVIMGAAVVLDGPSVPEHARKVNEEARGVLGESLNMIQIGAYDAVFAIKAAMEKAQSVEPAAVAAALPRVRFTSFYGTQTAFGRADEYGSPQQLLLPVFITRVEDGKLVLMTRVDPRLD